MSSKRHKPNKTPSSKRKHAIVSHQTLPEFVKDRGITPQHAHKIAQDRIETLSKQYFCTCTRKLQEEYLYVGQTVHVCFYFHPYPCNVGMLGLKKAKEYLECIGWNVTLSMIQTDTDNEAQGAILKLKG